MAGRIQAEIQQTKPIGSLEEEAYLNLQRTTAQLSQSMTELLKAHDLTPTQYNVLRILRGAGAAGLAAGEIGERMITRDPDVTRLLDRLERRGLVERWRCTEDRRVVWTRITDAGRGAIAPLDAPIDELHVNLLKHMGDNRLRQLIELLEVARDQAQA
jgi:DNA-binding MarR family transcriptional regulator